MIASQKTHVEDDHTETLLLLSKYYQGKVSAHAFVLKKNFNMQYIFPTLSKTYLGAFFISNCDLKIL